MNRRVQIALKALGLAAAYFIAGYFGLKLARIHPSVSAIWPPTGIAIASLLLWGRSLWPAVFIGAFSVSVATGAWLAPALGIATGNTLEAVIAASLVDRYARGLDAFDRAPEIVKFVLLAGFLSTLVSATVGVSSLCLAGQAAWHRFASIWLTWWTGDMIGALKFTPLIVIWSRPLPEINRRQFAEGVALILCVALFAWIIFDQDNRPLGFMMLPPLLWATLRFGRHGAITSTVVMSAIALWGTTRGLGPYATNDPNQSLLFVQAYIGIIVVSALILAAVVSENRRTLREIAVQEQQAQERVTELETLMEAAPAVIWIAHDPECKVITGNRLGEEILRAPSGKNLSMTAASGLSHFQLFNNGRLLSGSDLPMHLAARERRALWKYEMELRFSDGTSRWLYGNIVPLMKPDGAVRGVLSVFVDITERKQTEEALAQSRADLEKFNRDLDERVRNRTAQLQTTLEELETFSYSVSHDLRGPLRTIQGFSEIVLTDYASNLPEPGIELLRKVIRATNRMDRLIQDVLAFSRVSRQEIQIERVDVDKLIRQLMHERAEWQPPKATVTIQGTLPPVLGHEPSLTQCITNFLDNAVKFVAPGVNPRVVIGADQEEGAVRLWFQDNGIGIEPQAQERMFGMFQRFHRDAAYPGTGIGLAIARKAVERMNGTVGVESAPGQGSRFWLKLKRAH